MGKRKNKSGLKKEFLFFLAFAFILFSSYFASAHFVCGQVNDSIENVSSAWFNVKVFYPSTPQDYTTCQVSPDENKYCCDVESLNADGSYALGIPWTPGLNVSAKVYSPSRGYVAGPVSLKTTEEGYDVFPSMQIKKVIKIFNPNRSLIISNSSDVFFNATFLEPFNNVNLDYDNSSKILCENCTNFSSNINATSGMNTFEVIASSKEDSFFDNLTFGFISGFNLSRNFSCEKCSDSVLRPEKNVSVNLSLNLSDYVGGIIFEEYVPVDFKILNTTGEVSYYNNSYNVIRWNASGKNITEFYLIQSPKVNWPIVSTFSFYSFFGGNFLGSKSVEVKTALGFFHRKKHHGGFGSFHGGFYPLVLPNQPYLLSGQGNLQKAAFFPNSELKNVRFNVVPRDSCGSLGDVLACYSFSSNSGGDEINKTYIEFKVGKDGFSKSSEISLKYYNKEWKTGNVTFYKQDKNYFYFKGYVQGNLVAILNNNKSLFRILRKFGPNIYLKIIQGSLVSRIRSFF